ncbi:MAG: Gfo/Idh/MocA family oxidoreductase, partial [Halioglobus sp.]
MTTATDTKENPDMHDENKKPDGNNGADSTKQPGLNRRSFLGGSSLVAGGMLLGGTLAGCDTNSSTAVPSRGDDLPEGASVTPAGDRTLKIAVVGCGGRGTGAIANAMRADAQTELVAVADAFADNAESCASKARAMFGEVRVKVTPDTTFSGFNAYRKAIDLADVVILTTPPGFRPEHFEYAVRQGKHVFMEKPVATDAPGVRRVLDAARAASEQGLNVVVGLQRRYQPSYLEAFNRYREGAIGEIVSGQVYWNSSGVWVRPREAGQTEMEYQMRNWYYFNWLCGDHILEQHIHNIDVANWFIGDYPVSARGMGGRQARTGRDHGHIFDHHSVEFTYASGAVISSFCRHMPGCEDRVLERFQATGGQLATHGNFKGSSTLVDRSNTAGTSSRRYC